MDRAGIRYHSVFGDRADTGCIREGGESAVITNSKRGAARVVNYPGWFRHVFEWIVGPSMAQLGTEGAKVIGFLQGENSILQIDMGFISLPKGRIKAFAVKSGLSERWSRE